MHGQNTDRKTLIAAGAALVLVVGAVMLFLGGQGAEGEPAVNITNQSGGQAVEIPHGTRISHGEYSESIELVGAYAGHPFRDIYGEEDVKMRITSDLEPSDGVVDVWIGGRMVDNSSGQYFEGSIYVDDDFRENVGEANVAWGSSFTDNFGSLRYTEFDGGIYRHTLVDSNATRFLARGPYSGGETNIAVGNFSRGDVGDETRVAERSITLATAR